MNGIYELIVSGIDGNGFQYISGMLEPDRRGAAQLDAHKNIPGRDHWIE